MPSRHAPLGPSSSYRWLNCPDSAKHNQGSSASTVAAEEGTDAHSLCEVKLLAAIGHKTKEDIDKVRSELKYYDEDMDRYTDEYVEFVMMEASKIPNCEVFVEEEVYFTQWVPEGFGTSDCILVGDGVLECIDFKYGLGILVDATDNPQLKIYGLGAYNLVSDLYEIETYRCAIFQPRRDNVSSWETPMSEVLEWADKILRPRAMMAWSGDGYYEAGEHCVFCKIKTTCRKRAEYFMELEKHSNSTPDVLTDNEIAELIPRLDAISSWASDLKEYALGMILDGREIPGFKVVESRTNRKFTNPERVAELIEESGHDPYKPRTLKGMTDLQMDLGRKHFEELLGDYIEKPKGVPTLVRDTDKRPALPPRNLTETVIKDLIGE